jgi:uncharacterized protein (UPF0332 family)
MSLSSLALLEHADWEIHPHPRMSTSEEALRRATSTAYYAVFHAACVAFAELFYGAHSPTDSIYENIYRRPQHIDILNCFNKYKALRLKAGAIVDSDIAAFADAFQSLYRKRLDADYKPAIQITLNDAQTNLQMARTAIEHLGNAPADARKAFLSLIAFPTRNDP